MIKMMLKWRQVIPILAAAIRSELRSQFQRVQSFSENYYRRYHVRYQINAEESRGFDLWQLRCTAIDTLISRSHIYGIKVSGVHLFMLQQERKQLGRNAFQPNAYFRARSMDIQTSSQWCNCFDIDYSDDRAAHWYYCGWWAGSFNVRSILYDTHHIRWRGRKEARIPTEYVDRFKNCTKLTRDWSIDRIHLSYYSTRV